MPASVSTLLVEASLATDRIALRRFDPAAPRRVRHLAGDGEVAAARRAIPHPYPAGAAERWVERTCGLVKRGLLRQYAIAHREDGQLLGCVTLRKNAAFDDEAELGFWLGKPFRGRGYTAEAARVALWDAARTFALKAARAAVLPHNRRSRRVLEKLGFTANGVYRVDASARDEAVTLLGYRLSPLPQASR